MTCVALWWVVLAAAGVLPARAQSPPRAAPGPGPSAMPRTGGMRVALLLADGRLVVIDARDGRELASHRLVAAGEVGTAANYVRNFGLDRDGRSVVVVAPGRSRGATDVWRLDARSLALTPVARLSDGAWYEAVSVGRRTGSVYLVSPSAARLTVLAPGAATPAVRALPPSPSARSMYYQAAVSEDERRLYVAYHETGIDWYALDGGGARLCRACVVPTHGGFALLGTEIVATTGTRTLHVFSDSGRLERRIDTGLERNHQMEVAVDRARRRAYVVGSCLYAGGVSGVRVPRPDPRARAEAAAGRPDTGRRTVFVPTFRYPVCGERFALSPDGAVLAAISQAATDARMYLVDTSTGRTRDIVVRGRPIDVVVLP